MCTWAHGAVCGRTKTKNEKPKTGGFSFFVFRSSFFRAAAGGCGKMRKMRQSVHGKTRLRACDICGNDRKRVKQKCEKCEKMRRKCEKMRRKCDEMRRKCDEMRRKCDEMRQNAKVLARDVCLSGYIAAGIPGLEVLAFALPPDYRPIFRRSAFISGRPASMIFFAAVAMSYSARQMRTILAFVS